MLGSSQEQLAVDFIRADYRPILCANFSHPEQFLARIGLSGWIVWIAQQEHSGLVAVRVDCPCKDVEIDPVVYERVI